VAAIVDLPVAAILPGARLVPRERTFHDARLTYDAYPIDELPGASPGLVIWGMTARVLGGLGAWLADESERPPMVDELTGLRQYGDLRLPHLVRRRTAPWLELMRDGVALVAIDVHGFRAVNDRRGFGVGNAALREIGRRILATAGDLPAWRVSGDGFVVAMPDGGVAAAGALAERLRDEIRLPIHDPEAMDTGEVVLVEARFAVMEPGAGADLAQSLNALEYAVDVIARQPGEIVIASL
jgi:diguanylate cyclase (GGDEF)-like protein